MNAWELEEVLGRLRLARGATADRLAHGLRDVATEPWFDARVAAAVAEAFAAAGLPPPPLVPRPLAAGESWVLLADPGTDGGVVGRLRWTERRGARLDVEAALRGLRAACGRLCRQLPFDLDPPTFTVFTSHQWGRPVDGRSAGLAACVAVASRRLGQPPRDDTAASAVVEIDGRLAPVDHLALKLAALSATHPQIRRVVVARGQPALPADLNVDLELVRASRVEDALRGMGLDLGGLPAVSRGDHEARLAALDVANRRSHDARAWRQLALEAWETMQAFVGPAGDPRLAARSGAWAALFSLHAGDVEAAEATLDHVRATFGEGITGETAAWCAIVDASRAIDRDPVAAVALARAAWSGCAALAGEGGLRLLGLAIGTLGRALTHAGQLPEAETRLREALAHHAATGQTREVPRSGCHLATCLRLAGRLDDAQALVAEMIAACEPLASWDGPGTTRLYLALEQGRCLLASGRPAQALAALAPALDAPTDYPRASALRAAASARRLLGDGDGAWEDARACFEIRRRSGGVLARVAALAAGDVLLAERDGERRRTARDEWLRVFPSDEPAAIAAALAATIY